VTELFKYGGNIGPSKALNKFVLYFRYVIPFRNQTLRPP